MNSTPWTAYKQEYENRTRRARGELIPMPRTGKIIAQLAIIVAALAVLSLVKMPNHTQLWREFNNSGHALLFGAIAIGFLALSRQFLGRHITANRWHYLTAFALTSGLGALTEFIQIFSKRDADVYDLLMDVLGAAAFLCIAAAYDSKGRSTSESRWRRYRAWLTAAGLVFIALAFLSPGLWAAAVFTRNTYFPVICGFDSYWDTKWIKPIRATLDRVPPPPGFISATGTVGRFTTRKARFPKLEFIEVCRDWRGFSTLSLDMYSELDKPVNMAIRIDDIHHNDRFTDRFNRRLVVLPGLNQFVIDMDEIHLAPVGRQMDLEHIAQVLIFGVNPAEPFTIYLDNFQLR